jgi:acyl carrier protein
MSNTYEAIARVLLDKFDVPAQRINPDASVAELDLDSLAVVEFLDTLQEISGKPIDDTEVPDSATLAELTAMIDQGIA